MRQTLLLCRDCGTLLPLDLSVVEEADRKGSCFDENVDVFRAEHRNHAVEEVTRLPDSAWHDRPPWDPMSTSWFRVQAGMTELPVRSWRSSIAEPRLYHLHSEPLPEPDCWAEVDERLLRICLDRHFYPSSLPTRKLDRFVTLVLQLIGGMDPRDIETSFDDVDYPNAAIAPFPSQLSARLLSACAEVFDAEEVRLLAAFIETNRREDGALAIRVRRDVLAASA